MSKDNSDNFNGILKSAEEKNDKNELGKYLMSKLSNEQSDKLNKILHDDKALKDLLSTDKAKEILKKLTGEKDGQH